MTEASLAVLPASLEGDLQEAELLRLVLDSVTSAHSRRSYAKGLQLFFAWYRMQPQPAFTKALVGAYRAWLLEQGLSPATINLRLSPVRKLAREMADNGLLAPELAAAVGRVSGVKQQGVRVGNWLGREQASELLNAPSPLTRKGKRDRELLALTVDRIEQREGRWVIRDLVGKGNRRRTVPVPAAVKHRIEEWVLAAGITEGMLFRPISKSGKLIGDTMQDEKGIWHIVV